MKRKVKNVLVFMVLSIFSFGLMAESLSSESQNPEKMILTVDEATNYAINNSRTLKVSAIDVEIAKLKKDNAWNVFVPSVQISGTMSRSNEVTDSSAMMEGIMSGMMEMLTPLYMQHPELLANLGNSSTSSSESSEPKEADHWKAVGNVSVSWNFSFALFEAYRTTVSNYEAGLISYEQSVKQTERDVKKMFYGMLLMQENLKLQQEMLENAKMRMEQAAISYRNGQVPELSYLQAQVTYENKRPTVLEMEQTISQQMNTFAFLLGLPYGTKLELVGTIEPEFITVDSNELVEKYLTNRLDVQGLYKNIELITHGLTASKLQTFSPALALSYGFQPVVMDITKNWFEDENNMDNGSFSVTLAWNLTNMLPFSSNMVSLRETQKNLEKLELSVATVLQSGEMEIASLVDKLKKCESSIAAMEYNVELAEKAYNMTYEAYRVGTTEILDVRDSESQLSQAKLGLLNEKYTYLTTLLDLEYAINAKL